MTFSKKRIPSEQNDKINEWYFSRFCSELGINMINAPEKLLDYFIKNYNPKQITTYADCRWNGIIPEQTIHHKMGFSFMHQTSPTYFYLTKSDCINRKHRFTFAKHILLEKFGGDELKTEWELARENGYDRIWDCGSLKFEMNF